MAVIAELLRISIRTCERDIDLTVAAHLPLRDLLPALTDAIVAETGAAVTGVELRLSHPVTGPLDGAQSLTQSGVTDGELLVLTGDPSPRTQPSFDTCAAVATAVRSARPPAMSAATLGVVIPGWWAGVSAVLLSWPLIDSQAPRHPLPAVGIGCGVLLCAWLFQCRGTARAIVVALALGASGFATLAGWLAVPGGPGMANAALALSACAVGALAASQVCAAGAAVLRSLCTVSAAGATLSLAAVLHWCPGAAAGPMLAAGWLVVLSIAPRLVARGTRLSASDPVDENLTARTLIAQRRLTAVVATATAGAVLGSLMTTLATPRSPASIGLLAAVTVVLPLRMRIHRETHRSVALAVGGALVSTMLLGSALSVVPALIPWLCGLLTVGCVVAVRLAGQPIDWAGAGLRRVASAADFAATAAVAPLTWWAAGLFASVRDLSLP